MAKLRGKHYTEKDITKWGKKYYQAGKDAMKLEILDIIEKYCMRTEAGVFDELYTEVKSGYDAWKKKYYGKKVK
jgi:hypothetical protein